MKSGNLNFLELSGSLQACNGTALPLPLGVELNSALDLRGPPGLVRLYLKTEAEPTSETSYFKKI